MQSVRFNFRKLAGLDRHVFIDSSSPHFLANTTDENSRKEIIYMVSQQCLEYFADAYCIRSKAQPGEKLLSRAKEVPLEKDFPCHLEQVHCILRNKRFVENNPENADETHCVIGMGRGTTLGFAAHNEVKYADVVSAGDSIKMLFHLSGGGDARIEPAFMKFPNRDRSYPIKGTSDHIHGVSYIIGPNG